MFSGNSCRCLCNTAGGTTTNKFCDATPPGSLINIGGRRLHLNCTGNGSPTAVVENGDGAFSIDWALVQPGVSKFTRICTYDRAGYAWSDPGPLMAMADETTSDLHILECEDCSSLRLGWSVYGRAYVRAYQRRFPDQVVALVLVDATHDEGVDYEIDGKGKPISLVTADELRAFMLRLLTRNPPLSAAPTKTSPPYDRLPTDRQTIRLWAIARYFSNLDLKQAPYAAEAARQELVALI